MPTYEYKCPLCKEIKQVQHKMDEMPCVICLTCHRNMQKGFGGGSAIHLKGSGFYETDYKNK